MINNYFIIREMANYLDKNITGYITKEIYSQEKNKLLIELIKGEDDKILEFSIERGFNYLMLKNNFSKAKKNYADVMGEVYGSEVKEVKLYNDDRIIKLELSGGFEILFTFFTNKANCFLIKDRKIVNSFKDKEENVFKSIDEIIPARGVTETEGVTNIPLRNYIKLNYKNYPPVYVNEVLYRLSLSPENIVNDSNIKLIRNEFDEIEKETNHPDYNLYFTGGIPDISLIKLKHKSNLEIKSFEDVNRLLAEYVKLKSRSEKTEKLKLSMTSELEQKIANVRRKTDGIKIQLSHCEDSDELRKRGNAILQNIENINKGDKKFLFKDENYIEVSIKLKDNLTAVENAQSYFDKYKKQKASVNILKTKITALEKEIIRFESELKSAKEVTDIKTLMKEEKKFEENKKDETSRFRKFRLNDKYEVWVGKDSISNDLLTTKYASQNDLWFHVRGASGSHTVLKVNNKKEDVPKESILTAASIAAYYSKARNASNVPVAYCEKKYVKKKKGFKAGSVVMEREKVVFVKPVLPTEN